MINNELGCGNCFWKPIVKIGKNITTETEMGNCRFDPKICLFINQPERSKRENTEK